MECGTSLPKKVRRGTIDSVHLLNAAFKLLLDESVLGPPPMEMMAMKRREKPASTGLRHLPPVRVVPAIARPHAPGVLPSDYGQELFPDFAG